jgi:signal transduction histidine kinase
VGKAQTNTASHEHEATLAEYERRFAHLREVNEQLMLDVLDARASQAVAEQARRRQTELLAIAAHELRNPLTPIRTAAYLLSRVGPGDVPALQATIERQVVHLSNLVYDLIDVSRLSTGKLRLELDTVPMTDIVDAGIAACRPAVDARRQALSVDLPSCVLEVHGDPVRLTQILSNLLDNASKYTPDGGEIRISVAVLDETVVLTVRDAGIGITAEGLPAIFDLFAQGAHAVDFNGSGLGIGLTVVRELAEAHGGSVVATSAGIGLGSQFVVTLPLKGKGPTKMGLSAQPSTLPAVVGLSDQVGGENAVESSPV